MEKGTILTLLGNLRYEKLGNNNIEWWSCLDSNYLVPINPKNLSEGHTQHSEMEKPLYREGELNRWSIKMSDEQALNMKQ